MEKKGYRVQYRIKSSKETGIVYGPILEEVKHMMFYGFPDHEDIEYVVEYGVDGDWKIDNSEYSESLL